MADELPDANRAPVYVYSAQPLLISMEDATARLRLVTGYDVQIDDDLATQMAAASDAIRNYLKSANDPAWTDATVPPVIKAAVLVLLVNWWTHRGDDVTTHREDFDAGAWAMVSRMLMQLRDPALA